MGRLQGVEREIERAERELRLAEQDGYAHDVAAAQYHLDGLYQLREDLIGAELCDLAEIDRLKRG